MKIHWSILMAFLLLPDSAGASCPLGWKTDQTCNFLYGNNLIGKFTKDETIVRTSRKSKSGFDVYIQVDPSKKMPDEDYFCSTLRQSEYKDSLSEYVRHRCEIN